MKSVMTHLTKNFLRTKDVTHPLRADLAPFDHFRSMGELNPYTGPFPATHHHHIHYRPEFVLIAPIHSDS